MQHFKLVESLYLTIYFCRFKPEDGQVCLDFTYEIVNATQFVALNATEEEELRNKLVGTAIKLLYAFVWQEAGYFPNIDNATFTEEGNSQGWELLPILNNAVNDYLLGTDSETDYFNPNLQKGEGIYPGEDWCNPGLYPHAKWHLQTGIALFDLANLMDEALQIIKRFQDP